MSLIPTSIIQPPSPPAPPLIVNASEDIVIDVMADAKQLAEQSQTSALAAITALGDFSLTLPPIEFPSIPVPSITVPALGEMPVEPTGMVGVFPALPAEPVVGALATIELGAEPEFTIASPLLIDVPLPDPLSALLPTAPILSPIALPVEPDFVFPEVPTLNALNLPAVPVLDIPLFTATLGDSPAAPDASFTWAEVAYDTTLLSTLNTKAVDLISGMSTGLSPLVEDALWQRGRDREALLTQKAIGEATRMFAARGFSMPAGTLARVIQQALQDSIGRDATLSREVMIKQAELEQSNFQFSMNLAVQLESRLIEHFNTVQSRALDAAKFQFQAVIEIFNARVSLFQADVQAFATRAEVFKTRLQAALAQLEIYKSALEGQQLIGQLNSQMVEQYVAKLQGVKTLAEVYTTRVDAAKVQIEAQKQQVEIFSAQLVGYDSQVKSKASEYEAYATRVKAELTKVQMFGEQVGAYKSRVEAFGTLVTAKLGVQQLDFRQLQEFPLEVYKQKVATYQVSVSAEAQRLQSLIALFEGRVRAFGIEEGAKAAQVGAQVEGVRATTAVYTSQAQLALQAGEINLKLAVTAAETAQASLRAAGQLSGQLAAAALSARNVHASIQQSDSNSTNHGVSHGVSYNASNSYSGSISNTSSDVTTHSE